jgi:hypothetical protein
MNPPEYDVNPRNARAGKTVYDRIQRRYRTDGVMHVMRSEVSGVLSHISSGWTEFQLWDRFFSFHPFGVIAGEVLVSHRDTGSLQVFISIPHFSETGDGVSVAPCWCWMFGVRKLQGQLLYPILFLLFPFAD